MHNNFITKDLKHAFLLLLIFVVVVFVFFGFPTWLKNSNYRNINVDYYNRCVGKISYYKSIMEECLYNFNDIASNDCANQVVQDIQLNQNNIDGMRIACKDIEIRFNEKGYEIIAEPLSRQGDQSCKICASEEPFKIYGYHFNTHEAYNLYKKNCKKSRDVECLHK